MISPSNRTANFHYAIRTLVSAAEAQERAGRSIIYLNIGDPQAYGFRPPAHVVEAVARTVAVVAGERRVGWYRVLWQMVRGSNPLSSTHSHQGERPGIAMFRWH